MIPGMTRTQVKRTPVSAHPLRPKPSAGGSSVGAAGPRESPSPPLASAPSASDPGTWTYPPSGVPSAVASASASVSELTIGFNHHFAKALTVFDHLVCARGLAHR